MSDCDLLPEGTLLPPNATASERAIACETGARIEAVESPLQTLWHTSDTPDPWLPVQAWGLSVDEWDPLWGALQQREVIAAAIDVHRRKGTIGSVRQALESAGYPNSVITEGQYDWRYGDGSRYGDDGLVYGSGSAWAYYRVAIDRTVTAAQAESIRRLLARVAPARCHLDSLTYPLVAWVYGDGTLYGADTFYYAYDGDDYDWFVDSTYGYDGNDGSVPTEAFRTLNAAIAAAANGDRIGIRAGSILREYIDEAVKQDIVIGRYGVGDNPRLIGSLLQEDGWTASGNEWRRAWSETPPNVYVRSADYASVTTLQVGTYGSLAAGEWDYHDGTDTLSIRLPADTDPNGQLIEIPIVPPDENALINLELRSHRWTISDLDLLFGGHDGVRSRVDDLTLNRCRMRWNSFDGFGCFDTAQRQSLIDCTAEYNGSQLRDGRDGDGVSMHDLASGEIIGGIYRYNDKAEIDNGINSSVTTRRALIVSKQAPVGGWRLFEIGAASGRHRLESCIVIYEGDSPDFLGCYCTTSARVEIVNNTIINTGAARTGVWLGDYPETEPHLVANNIISGFSRGISYKGDVPMEVDGNNLWDNVTDYFTLGGTGLTPGLNDIDADPLWVDAPNGDYHIPPVSPCAGAGVATDADLDFDRVAFADPPSIGALEAS